MSTSKIQWIVSSLEAGLPAIRKSRDRSMMRETVMRIRQLRGILELRAKA